MKLRVLILAAYMPFSSPSLASVTTDLAAIDARLNSCIAKDSTNAGMKICAGDAYEVADKLLNQIYRYAVNALKNTKPGDDMANEKETLKRLVSSERAWIAYRDAECDLQGTEMLGGTGEGLVIIDCLFSMTKQRASSLDDRFNIK